MNILFICFYAIGRTSCVSFSVHNSVGISSELSIFISFLELAPSNFWVDEPQEISSDDVVLKLMSQLLLLLIFIKKKVVKTMQKYFH